MSDITRIQTNGPYIASQHSSAEQNGTVRGFFSALLWGIRFAQLTQAEQNALGVIDADALKRIAQRVDAL
ncbi:MAG: hypothetical protein GKS00_30080 [Alphaproteobacteria bacterium]|nr:hypothetical protein [Alphaproteobacteria bacterium]